MKRVHRKNKHLPGQQQKYAHQAQGHHHFHKVKAPATAVHSA
jgi:hypothetical protein